VPPESTSEEKKPREHFFRAPEQFGETISAPTFDEANRKYWGRIADRKDQILIRKYRKGELKQRKVGRGHVSKLAILAVVLVTVLGGTVAYAVWQAQSSAQTTLRSPISMLQSQLTLPDIWTNTSRSIIQDNAFVLNSGGRVITYNFGAYATVTFSNGTQTQNMSRLFSKITVTVSDYSQNLTTLNLLSPTQPASGTFTYTISGDRTCRIIISYVSKAVALGGTSASLAFTFLYSYSGQ